MTLPTAPAREAELIASAQQGDASALAELFAQYGPAMHAAAVKFTPRLSYDDAKQACAEGFLKAVRAFDASRPSGATRLAVLINTYLSEALWEAVADYNVTPIPARTMRRFLRILREAEGDYDRAEDLAPRFDMRSSTFAQIARVIRMESVHAIDALAPDSPAYAAKYAAIEDQILAKAAFAACSPDERAVLEMRYGFNDAGDHTGECSLAEIAERLEMPRSLVNRLHASGLAAAREALGAL